MAQRMEVPLRNDPSTSFLPWMVAFLVYVACLALAGAVALAEMSEAWTSGLSGSLTVEVPALEAEEAEDRQARVETVLELLAGTPGVASARPVPLTDMQAMLEPWLGTGFDVAALPLPRLVDVVLDGDAEIDLEALNAALDAAAAARADDHALWQERMSGFLRALQLVAGAVVAVVAGAAVVMVVFATRGGLAAHRETIELLHLIGAPDGYIARQFQYHALALAIRGALSGALLAAATVLAVDQAAAGLGIVEGATGFAGGRLWLSLLALPPIAALVAMMTARRTVLSALSRLG